MLRAIERDIALEIVFYNGLFGVQRLGKPLTRVEDKFLVNAVGRFVIDAISRGILSINIDDIIAKGLKTDNYHIRSNLLEDRSLFEKLTDKIATKFTSLSTNK
jgi:hypothetical protein